MGMLIAGANRHAKDILAFCNDKIFKEILFFDDVTKPRPDLFMNKFKVITSIEDIEKYFRNHKRFIIGTGGTATRKIINSKLTKAGGKAFTFKSTNCEVGKIDVSLGKGLNIMPYVLISNSVSVGDGTLLNSKSTLHHDVKVGAYCDIAPGATLLGGVKVGDLTMIGSNATILPNVKIGNNCKIGAGAVVIKNVPDNSQVTGVPGKLYNRK